MIDVILTCERCGRKVSDEPWKGNIENIKVEGIEGLLDRMKYTSIVVRREAERPWREKSILLCSDCVVKYYRVLDECDSERETRIVDFLMEPKLSFSERYADLLVGCDEETIKRFEKFMTKEESTLL